MAISLLEAARGMAPSRDRAIIEIYAKESQILSVAPVLPTGATHFWKVEDRLPYTTSATGTRAVNADFTASQGATKGYESKVKIYGGKIQVDRYISHNYPESVQAEEIAQIKALARQHFIDIFEGTGGQYIRGVSDWMSKDAAYTGQVVESGAANTPIVVTVDMIDELLSKINIIPGKTFLYMNDFPARKILKDTKASTSQALNASYTPDSLNGIAGIYTGFGPAIPVICARDGKGANLLSITELDKANGASNSQSIYAVTWGEETATLFSSNGSGVPAIQKKSDGSNFDYEVLEWFTGLAPQIPRSVAQLKYIKNALS